jgi:tetratricopeptide (TPR) repeat protein
MMMNPLSMCSSSSSSNSDNCNISPTAFTYKHQQLPTPSPQLTSIRDVPDADTTTSSNSSNSNHVLNQVMRDLTIARRNFGDNDSHVADAWNALGLVRIHMQRDVPGARSCHEQALRIYQDQRLPKETAITLVDLGYCSERSERRDDALQKYQQALDILQLEKISDDHPQVMSTKRAISRMLRR